MSSFNCKCTLLTRYLKENGGFGIPTLTPTPQGGGGGVVGSAVLPRTVKSMDLFPQGVGFCSHKEDVPSFLLADYTSCGPHKAETTPMTIFYAGQVLVFDDFPADKAKEVMLLAGRSCPHHYPASAPHAKVEACDEPGRIVLPIQQTPVAWRDSLLRFLEKRKDRITARASPYPQVKGRRRRSDGESTPHPDPAESIIEERSSWLSLRS
ncbi:hypothetical protein MLD38_015393 [Melastoma candidum]|uniref:Uncharacterized protein n=1 Tax=Melastoma candidum TaxID=119954 RepID=A0ACB9RG13_9MYRT|nr:hypothetical protein MLD38_015393 [Melastoma candidum]